MIESKGVRLMWDGESGVPLNPVSAKAPLPRAGGADRTSVGRSPTWRLTMSGTTVSVVNVATGREVGRLPANGWAETAVASPDGTRLATGDDEGVVRVWEPVATAGVTLQHSDPVVAASMNGDCSVVATSTGRDGVHVWDSVTGHERAQLFRGMGVGALALSFDGRVIAGARGGYDSQQDTVVIAEAASGKVLHRLRSTSAIREMVFSPDGNVLTTRSERTFTTWEVSSGTQLRAFSEDNGSRRSRLIGMVMRWRSQAKTRFPSGTWRLASGASRCPTPVI